MPTVLVIDDEPQIVRAVRRALAQIPAETVPAATGADAIRLARTLRPGPDAIVLDLGLPDAEGLSVCRELRVLTSVPLVVLSARTSVADKVALLDAGADDYLTKPFSMEELRARVEAHLRRADRIPGARANVLEIGELRIDLGGRTVWRGGRPVHLTPIEWDLLRTLVGNSGRTLTHRQLFDVVWRYGHGNAQEYLRVHIANLRRKIEPVPGRQSLIVTEAGVGYRFTGSREIGVSTEPQGG